MKTRCRDLAAALAISRTLSPVVDGGVQIQIDTYFHVPNGRLKLREIVGVRAELIWYDRCDRAESRRSDYRLTPITQPDELKASLASALGIRGEVKKRRHVLLWHNVRIHLDEVESLGSFVEFEAVITEGEAEQTGHQRLKYLCEVLKIDPVDYLDSSYADLMGLS